MSPKSTLNIDGRLIELSTPRVMGILNMTPDSFFAGSRVAKEKAVLDKAEKMIAEGATFLDVGGYSSRPGADDISEEEERKRIVPAIDALIKRFPDAIISIDTFRQPVAKAAIEAGAYMVNDISAGHLDERMIPWVGTQKVPYVAMHMRGTPQTMKTQTDYENVLKEVMLYFAEVKEKARLAGIHDLVIDPGFGFAKTLKQNYDLLNNLSLFKAVGCPILVGVSRKSMIYRLLDVTPEEALNGTSVLNAVALMKGAQILRVHDVKETVEVVRLMQELNDTGI